MTTPQTFENHARFVPGYHIALLGIFFISFVWSCYRLIHALFSGIGDFAVAGVRVLVCSFSMLESSLSRFKTA